MHALLRSVTACAATLLCISASAITPAEPIQPIPPAKISSPELVELGKKLYFEPRLSKSGFLSCNSCHNLSMGGTDNLTSSIGHKWQQGPINSPTVLNARYNVAQFWDGRAKDLQAQAGGPIANPGEMAATHELALQTLASIPAYQSEFKKVFKQDSIGIAQVTKAIAAFEETLVTPNSRFDQWLKGNKKVLTAQESAGYQLFKDSGCAGCHNGVAVGGGSFQKLGIVAPFQTTSKAQGRFDVTGQEADRNMFKVPTLRNIELTYPYFHDGSAATLTQAVDVMGRVQLGRQFSADENAKIVAFLKTLTGEQPRIAMPVLPPSTDSTPRPHPFE